MKQLHILLFVVVFYCFFTHLCDTINVKLIPEFIWGDHRGRKAECDIPCEFSANPENADAEYYIAMGDGDVRNAVSKNSKNPIKILGSREPQHYYPLLKMDYLKQHFQGTSLFDRHSDIPWAKIPNMDKVKMIEMPTNAKPKATYVARNCNPKNNRHDYIRAIDEAIGVLAPSTCFHNMPWPQCNGRVCTKAETIRDYKIHLAFENGDSPGFITDKIYTTMEAAVLPVWMGTRDIAEAVPKGSYVDVADFDSPRDVANYLKMLLENETMYNSYFEWKHKSFDPEFEAVNRVLWEVDHYCRVCYYVDAMKRGVEWDHFHQTAVDRIPGETAPTNPTDGIEGIVPEKEVEEIAPEKKVEEIAPEKKVEEIAPDKKAEEIAPEKKVEEIAPEKKVEEIAPEKKVEEIAPEKKVEEIAPEKKVEEINPENKIEEIAPEKKVEEITPEKKVEEINPENKIEENGLNLHVAYKPGRRLNLKIPKDNFLKRTLLVIAVIMALGVALMYGRVFKKCRLNRIL